MHKILSKLLDRCETSGGKRGITLSFTQKFYPDYFDPDNSVARDEINAACVSLQRDGFIDIQWRRFLEGHELKKIILKEEAIQKAYSELNRLPKNKIIDNAIGIVSQYAANHDIKSCRWLTKICEDAISAFRNEKPFFSLRPSEPEKIKNVFNVLRAISTLDGNTILKKRLSIIAFNDSKALSKIEATLTSILKAYGVSDGETEREIMESAGIISKPDITLMSGKIIIGIPNTDSQPLSFNLSPYPCIGIPTSTLKHATIIDMDADYVITIENETSFHEYVNTVKEKYIAIFISGYPNSGRIALLKAITDFAASHNINIPFYHWGDIDFGGYDIIRSYREKTGINVIPHLMEPELVEKSPYAVKLEETKRKRLEEFITKNRFQDLTDMALRLLRIGKRLEQESIEARSILR